MNFKPSDIIDGRSLEEAQIELERKLIQQGYDKDTLHMAESYDRAVEGKGMILELPKGKQLFLEVYNSVLKFLEYNLELELKKPRKSKYYNELIEPMVEMHSKELKKKSEFSKYEIRYENPLHLLPYFITKELTRLMVKEEITLTVFCRKVVNPYMNAYNYFGEASDEALNGMLQIFRTYIATDFCKYFETKNYTDGIVIVLKPEFHNIKVSKDEILEQIIETKTQFKPMIIEPLPHRNLLDRDGGYYEIPSPVLKNPEFAEVRQMPYNSTNEEGQLFFNVINKLQSTEWCVNTDFLDWLKECKDERISKMFNNNIKKMQIALNKYRRKANSKMFELKKQAAKAKYDSTQTTNEDKKLELVRLNMNLNDEVDKIQEELTNEESKVGKARGWQDTLSDAEFYREFDHFYHPVFCDNRGRVYTYNTSLSFQGSSLSKSLVSTKHTERLNSSGLYELTVLLGGMIDGYDKKSPSVRYNRVQELTEAMEKCITHEDYSVMDMIDEDELLMALSIMQVLFKHKYNEDYKTGIIAYIDATSSAIQIQALIQKCSKAAELTNLLPNSTDDLPDAYKAVALNCKEMCEEIAVQTNEQLFAALAAFYIENDESKLPYMGIQL